MKGWRVFTAIVTVLSIINVIDDIVEWQSNFQLLVDSYNRIARALWRPIFSALGLNVTELQRDYLSIGVLFASTTFRSQVIGRGMFPGRGLVNAFGILLLTFTGFLGGVLLWPLTIIQHLIVWCFQSKDAPEPLLEYYLAERHALINWIGLIVLLVFSAVLFNAVLKVI